MQLQYAVDSSPNQQQLGLPQLLQLIQSAEVA